MQQQHPTIIQGGMGVGISNWQLAQAVSRLGQLGVVSGTGMATVLVRRLQDGDPGGHMHRALARFPVPAVAQRALDRYYSPGGKRPDRPYRLIPLHSLRPNRHLTELNVLGTFVEVVLAREGHQGPVGVNLLEKIQLPNLPSLYGAMLAGADYVLMGAGIPTEIPGALDGLAAGHEVALKVHVEQASGDDTVRIRFDPRTLFERDAPPLARPTFLAIVASVTLAQALLKRSTGQVNGFIVEGPTAGGHNAPPRGPLRLSERGEPLYGPKDELDPARMRELGLPFWLAGSYANRDRLREARAAGAQGIQVGTAFALCRESGLADALKAALIREALDGTADVLTDPSASPTGFPFKVARLSGTLSESDVYEGRPRRCDLGYLRTAYRQADGGYGFRCPAEPLDDYLRKGGDAEEAVGRKCLCNALMANMGVGQIRTDGFAEPPLVTMGDDLRHLDRWLPPGQTSYSATDVLAYLLGGDQAEGADTAASSAAAASVP